MVAGAHNPKGRSIEFELVIPPVVKWHLQENSIYGMPSSCACLLLLLHSTYHIRSFGQVLFDKKGGISIHTRSFPLGYGLLMVVLQLFLNVGVS